MGTRYFALPWLCLVASPVLACGTCGCLLNTDWASQGFTSRAGYNLDLRSDYLDQSQLRTGAGRVNPASLDLPSEQEIQRRTLTRLTTLGLEVAPSADWGLAFQIPLLQREHVTVAEGDTEPSNSRASGLGDVRVLGRYQGLSADHSFGVQLGFKLDTGGNHDTFRTGPQAGVLLDRGLQLGTGGTDLLLGLYRFGQLGSDWACFAQALWEKPLGSREAFRPGASFSLSAGLSFTGSATFTPQLQVNLRAEARESGADSDLENSGSERLYLSPGLSLRAGRRLQVFAFIQVPVHQRVNGWQLEPKYIATAGLRVTL